MWIKELVLSNIQSYKDQRIQLSSGINLIVGKNNSGKSAILRSLLIFQAGGFLKPESLLRKFETWGFVLALFEGPTTKRLSNNVLLFDAALRKITNPPLRLPLVSTAQLSAELRGSSISSSDIGQFPDVEPNNIIIPFLAKRKPLYFNGNFDESAIKKIEHDLRNLTSKLSRAQGNTVKRTFEKACEDIIGFSPAILPGTNNQTFVVQYVGTNESIPLDQMGEGVTQILGLLLSLFHEKNKIFIIEELENDLHPIALKQLLDLIIKASKQNQFVISTHSNIVVRMLGSLENSKIFETTSILVADPKTDTSMFESQTSELENDANERIRVLGELGYELLDFNLYEGYLILEESSAEKIVRDFLIPGFFPTLKHRLCTIGAKGAADVTNRLTLLKSLFTFIHKSEIYHDRAWICVDGDAEGLKAIEKCKETFDKKWDPKYFRHFSKSNFEDFYPPEYKERINAINSVSDRKKRSILKLELANQIVNEFTSNPEPTKVKFEQSAAEVISLLKSIESDLGS